jgi:hypothetical protein
VWLGNVKGVSFEPYASNLRKVYAKRRSTKIKIILARDVANAFDPYAICVYFNNLAVGYIPRSANQSMLNVGLSNLSVSFVGFNLFDDRVVGACIKVGANPVKKAKPERHLRLVQKLTNTPRKILM